MKYNYQLLHKSDLKVQKKQKSIVKYWIGWSDCLQFGTEVTTCTHTSHSEAKSTKVVSVQQQANITAVCVLTDCRITL